MIETMKTASGIGLAAPQIYISKRIIVFYLPSSRDDSGGIFNRFISPVNPIINLKLQITGSGVKLTCLINPVGAIHYIFIFLSYQ